MAEQSTIAHLRGLEGHLRERIRGQDPALAKIAAGFCRAALALASPERPRASFLLVGPSGTGKSETFACATNYVFGADHLAIFDMSEYQEPTAASKLLGDNRNDPGLLGRALSAVPKGGLLFDEIEKAHPLVMDLFLQMLWRGCITVATGQVFRTNDYVIGFTSNIGSNESIRMTHSSISSVEQATLRRVEQSLRPELLGRIDEKIVFTRLPPDVQRDICFLETNREIERLRHLGFDLIVTREALDFLITEGFHPSLGARALRKTIERQLQDAVVRDLFSSGIGGGTLFPDREQRRLIIRRQ